MLEFIDGNAILIASHGSLRVPDDDEITLKLAMLYEGRCEGLGPTAAAKKYNYTKQRFFQVLRAFEQRGAIALKSERPAPRTNYRRTGEAVKQVVRYKFLDANLSAEVIAQKLRQCAIEISARTVERVIQSYGLQKKTLLISTRPPIAKD